MSVATSIVSWSNVPNATNCSIVVIVSVTIVLTTLYNTFTVTSSNKGPIARLISLPDTSIVSLVVIAPLKSKLP